MLIQCLFLCRLALKWSNHSEFSVPFLRMKSPERCVPELGVQQHASKDAIVLSVQVLWRR